VDWSLFHLLNGWVREYPSLADYIEDFVTYWAVPVFVLATVALWFLDRPGPWYRFKIACLSGLTAAALGLLASQVITHFWVRERPFVVHPNETVLLAPPSNEPSFPSDHAIAAFAIAFSVALIGGRRLGALFLAAATLIGVTRVIVGLHYPGDIAGGALIGFLSASLVFVVAGGHWVPVVRLLSRATDPLVKPAWDALDARKARRRARSAT
jgi:undecaprenyl-diphosphatase